MHIDRRKTKFENIPPPSNLAEQSVSVPVEINDASVVSVPCEVVVHFCRLSRYAVAPRLFLGMPGYDLFLGGDMMINLRGNDRKIKNPYLALSPTLSGPKSGILQID